MTIEQNPKPKKSTNTFDNLPALSAPRQEDLRDELDRYLSTDPEEVADPLRWWFERKHMYPRLYRMALDYLSIPREFSTIFLRTDTDNTYYASSHVSSG